MMERYGNTGLMLDAHSRGSMTVGNALQSHSRNNGDGKLINTDVNFYGPAYSAQKAADLLYELSAGMKDHVSLQNHGDDFVGSILGSNPSTHTQIPADSNKVKEWIRMFSSPGTVHSCYGAAGPACIERYGDARTMEIKAKGSK
ncbi:hypothetical protein D3C84_806180 [compost metagenome]